MSKNNETEIHIYEKDVKMDIHTFLAEVSKVASMATPLLCPNFNIILDCQRV